MHGIPRLAFKLLMSDRAKFTVLTVGITFPVRLMIVAFDGRGNAG